jgi:ribosomal protein S11
VSVDADLTAESVTIEDDAGNQLAISTTGGVTVTDDGAFDINSLPEPVTVDAGITDGAVQITDDDGDTLHVTSGGRMLVSVPGVVETTTPSTTSGSTYGVQTADGTASLVLDTNENRESLLLQNKGSEPMYVGFDNSVTTANGVEVAAGGTYADDTYTGPVYAITGGGSVNVAYQDIATS